MTYQFEEDQNQTLNIYALNTESRIVSKQSKALEYVITYCKQTVTRGESSFRYEWCWQIQAF